MTDDAHKTGVRVTIKKAKGRSPDSGRRVRAPGRGRWLAARCASLAAGNRCPSARS